MIVRFALRFLLFGCLLLTPGLGLAQSAQDYCEPTAAMREDFQKLVQIDEQNLPFEVRRQQRNTLLQEFLTKYPGSFHVQRRYLDTRLAGYFADRAALRAEYRSQMEKNPNDPIATYLYARLLVGYDSKQAISLFEKLTEQSPDFPWGHLQLAQLYRYQNFQDATKAKEHVKAWMAKCPDVTDSLSLISRSGDKEMMATTVKGLRTRLESSTRPSDLALWEYLWSMEFKLAPVPEHPQLRQKITDDMKRLRDRYPNSKDLVTALQAGYTQIGDKAGKRAAEDEFIRMQPNSSMSLFYTESRYREDHPFPKPDAPAAELNAYQQGIVQVTTQWLARWPNEESLWGKLIFALAELEGTKLADMDAAYNSYLKAHEKGGAWRVTPPLDITVARFYLQHGFHVDRVPALINKGLAETEQIESNSKSDLVTRDDDWDSLKNTRLQAWPLLAEAYARLKQPAKAQEVLAQFAELAKPKEFSGPNKDARERSLAYTQSDYWQAVAKVAEVERRKLDALTAYQTAMMVRPKTSATGDDQSELGTTAKRLWKELGGTPQGWHAYLARVGAAKSRVATAEVATWDAKNTALPEFELTDLAGRKWSLADLKGKVAFINLWATWCGPCKMELPYVEKLRERLKDRKDVLVLTLNTDEEIGRVEPFMKENKYTFPVLLGQAYADSQGVNSIPRNWVVAVDGKILFEGIGWGNDGEEWMKRAADIIEKVKGSN
jgi:thiol-disulfide isomerase/thioredoxin/tetratricopeptide (TPR) repeat protein